MFFESPKDFKSCNIYNSENIEIFLEDFRNFFNAIFLTQKVKMQITDFVNQKNVKIYRWIISVK